MQNERLDPVAVADAALDRVVALQAEIDTLTARRTEAIHEFERAFDASRTDTRRRWQTRQPD